MKRKERKEKEKRKKEKNKMLHGPNHLNPARFRLCAHLNPTWQVAPTVGPFGLPPLAPRRVWRMGLGPGAWIDFRSLPWGPNMSALSSP
jgi:hypothetical protein